MAGTSSVAIVLLLCQTVLSTSLATDELTLEAIAERLTHLENQNHELKEMVQKQADELYSVQRSNEKLKKVIKMQENRIKGLEDQVYLKSEKPVAEDPVDPVNLKREEEPVAEDPVDPVNLKREEEPVAEDPVDPVNLKREEEPVAEDPIVLDVVNVSYSDPDNSFIKNIEKQKRSKFVQNYQNRDMKKRDSITKRETQSVAFSAQLSSDNQQLAKDQTIVFDRVLLNEGNMYNKWDGVFVCPEAGIYLFSYNIFHAQRTGTSQGAYLKVNGNPVLWTYAETYTTTNDNNYTNYSNSRGTTVVKLSVGDHVWVASDMSYTSANSQKTTFMGVLITS